MLAEGEIVDNPMGKRQFNTRDFIEAMKQNGYRKAHGNWIQYKGSKEENGVYAACAGGQAFLNLGVKPKWIHDAVPALPTYFSLSFTIPNDQSRKSVTQIASELENDVWYKEPREFSLDEKFFND